MASKEIKEMRLAGKLDEALKIANAELSAAPDDIWTKRNISWVYYDYIKENADIDHIENFIYWLDKIKALRLPFEEKMLFDNICWQVGKMVFSITNANSDDFSKTIRIFDAIKSLQFSKPSQSYSFLFKAFHKALKNTDCYLQVADWWDIQNLMSEDFEKGKMPDGKDVMAFAEQVYIAYAKHLLPKQGQHGEFFDKKKALDYLPILTKIVDNYPHFQYPGYYNAKLLLAIGDKQNAIDLLLPFAKKKRNDFWVWEVLAEAFASEPDKIFACYSKALSCKSPEEMLINLRQKMAAILISKNLFIEAKTEIEQLVQVRKEHKYTIPKIILLWQSQEWYKTTMAKKSNLAFYKQYSKEADLLLYSDIHEETVIIEFVNSDKKILNFIASEYKFGFFKYDQSLKDIKIGDILKVRFQANPIDGPFKVFTAIMAEDDVFKKQFFKVVNGQVKIPKGKSFGFINDVFIHPSLVEKRNLFDGLKMEGFAIRTFNQDKKKWGWKLI